MTHTNPNIEEFEKEFCELLPYQNTELLCWKGIKQANINLIPTARAVREFIVSALHSQATAIYAGLEELIGQYEELKHHEACLATEYGEVYCDCGWVGRTEASNQERSRIRSLITNKKNTI